MRPAPALLALALSQPLAFAGGEDRPAPPRDSGLRVQLAVQQITPGEGLRDANSRSGYGAMVAFEGEAGRLVLEGALFPVQSRLIDGTPRRVDVAAWGFGGDLKLPVARHPEAELYGIAGLRLDYWVTGQRGEEHPDNSAGSLGLRVGFGARLGRVVGEARYRLTFGDARVDSATSGPAHAWSAVELSVGVLF